MKKYDLKSKCEKCGYLLTTDKYVDRVVDSSGGVMFRNVIVRKCNRCEAVRYELPLDAEEE